MLSERDDTVQADINYLTGSFRACLSPVTNRPAQQPDATVCVRVWKLIRSGGHLINDPEC